MLGLRWSDLNLDVENLTVNQSVSQTKEKGIFFKGPKRKKSKRTISIPQMLVTAFREHRELQLKAKELFGPDYHDHDLVICQPDGNPWSPDGFTQAYKDFARKYVGQVRFHDLRHTHASELLRRGMPLKTVSERLGHANASITLNTYAHVMTGDDREASDLVQNLLFNVVQKQKQAEAK